MHYHTLKTVLLADWKGNANVKGKEDKKKIPLIYPSLL